MKLRNILKIYPALWETNTTLHLVGSPGTAKTYFVTHALVQAMIRYLRLRGNEFGVNPVNLTSYEAPDVRGFLMPRDEDGELLGRFTKSTLIPGKDAPAHGIVFLDEFSQCSADVQKPAAEFILEGKAGDHHLPKGWRIITAGNRLEDRAGVVKTLAHVENRRCVIKVDWDAKDWASDFAQPHGIHPLLIAGAMFLPGVVCSTQPAEGGSWCTPRSYTKFCDFVSAYVSAPEMVGPALKDDADLMEVACGMIGRSAAAQMLGFLSVATDVPTYAQVLKSPDVCAKLPPGRMDVLYATTQMVLSNARPEHADELFCFATHLPTEFQAQMLSELIKKCGPKLVLNKKFAGWMSQPGNAAFVTAVMGV